MITSTDGSLHGICTTGSCMKNNLRMTRVNGSISLKKNLYSPQRLHQIVSTVMRCSNRQRMSRQKSGDSSGLIFRTDATRSTESVQIGYTLDNQPMSLRIRSVGPQSGGPQSGGPQSGGQQSGGQQSVPLGSGVHQTFYIVFSLQ